MKPISARDRIQHPGTLTDMQREEGGNRIAMEEVITTQVQVPVPQQNIQQKQTTVNIMFQNINGLPVLTTHTKNDSIWDTINRLHLDILGMAKVNVAWHKVKGHTWLGKRSSEWFEAHHISQAWNQTNAKASPVQVGGVALFSINKMVHHVAASGADKSGLGRWAWMKYQG